MKVLDVRYEVTPTVKQVTCKADYDKVQKYVYDTRGVIITPWDELDIQHKGNIVVFLDPWECEVELLENNKRKILKYNTSVGFISDKGSVPTKLRSIVDNDDPQFLIGFYIHDINYDCHYASRSNADQLLRAMGEYRGAGLYKRNKVYWALKIAGAKAYRDGKKNLNRAKKKAKFQYYYKPLK
jgi:hypothetical protein